jgi:hypothetical protein
MTILEAKEEARKRAAKVVFKYADDAPHPDIGEEDAELIADAAISTYEEALLAGGFVTMKRSSVERLFVTIQLMREFVDGVTGNEAQLNELTAKLTEFANVFDADDLLASQAHDNQQRQQRDKTKDAG